MAYDTGGETLHEEEGCRVSDSVANKLRAAWTTLMPTVSAVAARMARVMFVASPRLPTGCGSRR